MLKDEPEDLTHLAPTAGDVDVPLETTCFMSDMFDDFILSDTYCPLLTEDLNTLSDSQSSHSSSNKGEGSNSNDPFFSYRDETSSSGGSPSSHLHSPALSKVPVFISLKYTTDLEWNALSFILCVLQLPVVVHLALWAVSFQKEVGKLISVFICLSVSESWGL